MVAQVGKFFINLFIHALKSCRNVGVATKFTLLTLKGLFSPEEYYKTFFVQLKEIGFDSLPVVGITAVFSGAVLALQNYVGFERFSTEGSVATVVVLSITRELGPVLAGLMVAGRVSSAIAAEIGSMKVTEQIDALTMLSTNPIKYLVTPRVLASVICLPFLVLIADALGVFGGFLISVYKIGFNPNHYILNTFEFLEPIDVISGLVKAVVFGFIIASVSCYFGFYSSKGAQGVGDATKTAVVNASVLILFANLIITELFFR